MLNFKARFSLEEVIASKWFNEHPIDKVELGKDMQERKSIVLKNKQSMGDQMEVDDNEFGDDRKFRGGDDEKEALEVFEKNLKNICFDDLELCKWEDTDRKKTDFMKFKIEPSKLLQSLCTKLILKYPSIQVNLSKTNFKASVDYTPDMEKLKEIEDISKLPPTLDFDFEIFDDEESSVVHFTKNEVMSQYDFKTFYNELRVSYESN